MMKAFPKNHYLMNLKKSNKAKISKISLNTSKAQLFKNIQK